MFFCDETLKVNEHFFLQERKYVEVKNFNMFCRVKTCSNEANMLVQHHPTFLDAIVWPRLNIMLDIGKCSKMLA